jgi:hypothetical protein
MFGSGMSIEFLLLLLLILVLAFFAVVYKIGSNKYQKISVELLAFQLYAIGGEDELRRIMRDKYENLPEGNTDDAVLARDLYTHQLGMFQRIYPAGDSNTIPYA